MNHLATPSFVLPENQVSAGVWNSGAENYDRISQQIADAIEHCVDRLAPQTGEVVLDVATGTGWTARRVAARGSNVMGVDICDQAIEVAESKRIDDRTQFQVGDAESLPYGDGLFDCVVSTFGVMFCGNPEKAADELARVCRPGGRLALAVWDNQGGILELFKIISRYKPVSDSPPPSPFEWAETHRLEELLGKNFDLKIEKGVSLYRDESAKAAWEVFTTSYGPIKTLVEKLEPGKLRQFQTEFLRYHRNHKTEMGILVPRPYLIVKGVRK